MRKTSEKAQSTAAQDQKGQTPKKDWTGNTGVVTSLRIQKRRCGKASDPEKEKQAGDRQQPGTNEDLFLGEGWSSSTSPTAAWPAKTLWVFCWGRDAR